MARPGEEVDPGAASRSPVGGEPRHLEVSEGWGHLGGQDLSLS